jgi:PAS domain S-box-containing protein
MKQNGKAALSSTSPPPPLDGIRPVKDEVRASGTERAPDPRPNTSSVASSSERSQAVLTGDEPVRAFLKRHRSIHENSPEAVIVLEGGAVVDANEAALRLFRCEAREQLLSLPLDALAPACQPSGEGSSVEAGRRLGEARADGIALFEWVQQRRDGSTFPAKVALVRLIAAGYDAHLCIVRDIGDRPHSEGDARDAVLGKLVAQTIQEFQDANAALRHEIKERAKAEEAMRSAYRELDQIFMTATGGMRVVDMDFNVRRANGSLARMAGRPAEAMLGRKCWETFPGPSCKTERCTLERMKRGETTRGLEVEKRTADGRAILCSVDAREMWDENGRLVGMVQDFRDLTETKRLQSIAEAVNTSNNIGFVFSGIRHEMGNPVNAIKTTLTVLRERLDGIERGTVAEYVDRALGDVGRMEYLLKGLRNYNMFETPVLERLEIAGFFERLLPLLRPDVDRQGIRLDLQCAVPGLAVRADPRALQQVLLNLVTNSVDALNGRPEPWILVSAADDQDCAVIEISDNGKGMSRSEAGNLFRPFFTSKRGGTGLGLVIVKKTLALMNGVIEVSSLASEGTLVRITLPKD